MRCLEPMIITEILRLKEMNFTLREIGEATKCSKTTAGEILSRCKECGLTYDEAINLSQEWKEGKVKLSEPRSGTKDIIVSFAYGNYVSSLIINKLEQNENNDDEVNLDDWQWLSQTTG